MLTPAAMLTLAADLTDAQAHGDARSLAAIAWQLYGEAGEDLAEIARLRAAVHAAWNRPGKPRHPLQPEPNQPPPGTKAMSRSGPEALRVLTAATGNPPSGLRRRRRYPAPSRRSRPESHAAFRPGVVGEVGL